MNSSLSIFFPCYNDGATIASMVIVADFIARELTNDYEIIVIDDGSKDHSHKVLEELKVKYSNLKIIYHEQNKGYGGALRSGLKNSTKDLIFYTDGDAQYDVRELKKLWPIMQEGVDVVNGYKIKRLDPIHRIIIGKIYQHLIKCAFSLKIRDVDCDFRLMRKRVFDNIQLTNNSGVICVEMIKKIQSAGYRFEQIGVNHFFRAYGKSQIFNIKRIVRVLKNLFMLWVELVLRKKDSGERI